MKFSTLKIMVCICLFYLQFVIESLKAVLLRNLPCQRSSLFGMNICHFIKFGLFETFHVHLLGNPKNWFFLENILKYHIRIWLYTSYEDFFMCVCIKVQINLRHCLKSRNSFEVEVVLLLQPTWFWIILRNHKTLFQD